MRFPSTVRYLRAERDPDSAPVRPIFRDEAKFAADKLAAFQYVIVAVFLYLAVGYWDLQVLNQEYYSEKAYQNQIKSLPILAPRGKILDRDGRVIVDNHESYRLILSRENLELSHLRPIALGLNLDAAELEAKVRRYQNQPTYLAIPLKEELNQEELAFVEAFQGSSGFPELELIKSQYRLYPQGGLAAHLIGYIGEISDAELNSADWAHHNPGDLIGKVGVERYYNDHLSGIDGQRQVRVDNRMNTREVLGIKAAVPGRDLHLTIDLDLQVVAEMAMEDKRGAVVALDPRSGEVLALVSRPSYDPNRFARGISPREFAELVQDPYLPLFNRALQAQLAPGSTFKPILALAALETGAIDENFTVYCNGGATWYGRYFKCHRRGGHGTVNLHTAIAQSCDVFFYAVGNRLGIDAIAKYAEMVGLGRRTGIDLPGEKEGLVPSSQWKIRTQREKWYAGETISVAIGQGALTVTPLQLAFAIGGIAAGGVFMRPHVARLEQPEPPVRKADFRPENLRKVVDGMCAVVNGWGTAAASRIPGIAMCGKTGTAQLASNDLLRLKNSADWHDNAWFVGFAPPENPEIVVAVLWENGAHGDMAAPIARDVIKSYFDKKKRIERLRQPPASLASAWFRPAATSEGR